MRGPENTSTGQRRRILLSVVGHVEIVLRRRLETLLAVPGHVLDHEERTVGNQDVIQRAMTDDGFVEALDDLWKDGETARRGFVAAINEDTVGTFGPWHDWSVDGFLHVGTVEIDGGALWEVVERAGEAEDVPEEGAGGRDLVDIEAGVNEGDGGEDVVPKVAGVGCVVGGWG